LSRTIPIDRILSNPNISWDWYNVAWHPMLTINHVINNQNLPWNYTALIDSLPAEDILKHNYLNWPKHLLRCLTIPAFKHPGFNIAQMLNDSKYYANLNYNSWYDISSNCNIFIDDIIKTHNLKIGFKWNVGVYSNPNLKLSDFSKIAKIGINIVDYKALSRNPNLTFEYISQNINYNWDWVQLSSNKFNYDPYRKRNALNVFKKLYIIKIYRDVANLILSYISP
jgi:hypothetical protein